MSQIEWKVLFCHKHCFTSVFPFAFLTTTFSYLLQSIANWLFFRDNIKEAVTRPRLHCQLFPPTVVYEPTFPADLIPKLQSYSHAYVTNSTYDVSGMKLIADFVLYNEEVWHHAMTRSIKTSKIVEPGMPAFT